MALPQWHVRKRRLFFSACVAVLYGFGGAQTALAQVDGPSLSITLNRASFAPGDAMVLTATLDPGATSTLVDAYIVVQLPTGQYLSLQLGGILAPGMVPIARGLRPLVYQAPLVQYTFSGAEPRGTYTWYAGLARVGTMDFATPVRQVAFTFNTSTPSLTRLELSSALRSGSLEAASAFVGSAAGEGLRGVDPQRLNAIASALNTCAVVETTERYQVCATNDDQFRFILVRDEEGVWRVFVW